VGIYVLPTATTPTLPINTTSKDRTNAMQLELARDQMHPNTPTNTKRKKKRGGRGHNAPSQTGTNQSRSNVNFCVSEISEWQYPDNMQITDIQDLYLLDEFISNKVCMEKVLADR
jgi:hypothetical protein